MSEINLSVAELKNILKEVYCITGLNFSEYSISFIKHRTESFMDSNGSYTDTDLIYKINKSLGYAGQFLDHLFVRNSELFRDAEMWNYFENKIIPKLSSKKRIKVYFPFSRDSKELYSLLYILDKFIFNSEFDILVSAVTDVHLKRIKHDEFNNSDLKFSAKNIELLNSAVDTDDVFVKKNNSCFVKHNFKGNINYEVNSFFNEEHLLEFDMIFCRNTFIYFSNDLQEKAEKIITRSLKKGGLLFIGTSETIIKEKTKFKTLDKDLGIYKKKTLS